MLAPCSTGTALVAPVSASVFGDMAAFPAMLKGFPSRFSCSAFGVRIAARYLPAGRPVCGRASYPLPSWSSTR